MQSPNHRNNVLASQALSALQASITGELFTPEDDGYEAAWRGWNLAVQQHPAVVVVARTPEDVAQAVRFAADHDLAISVQSTGHGTILPANDSMMIVTKEMNDVRIDAETQSARIGAGAQWGTVLGAAQAHGLAPLLGSSPTVGVVGYTLGGGLGWLARKYGLAIDSVRSINLVTTDGQFLTASADENSDLFWALRGGGGGFGVVTALEIKLHPVSTVFGGTLMYPIEMAAAVMKRYKDWTMDLPEEWTTSVRVANFPPVPMLPDFLRGKSFAMVSGCYCGDPADGEAYLEDWLAWGAHIQNSFAIMPFGEVASISQDPVDPVPATHSGAWLNELNDDVIETILQFATPQNGPCPLTITEVRHVGGAMARVDGQENAFGLRDCPLLMDIVAMVGAPEMLAMIHQHVHQFKSALSPHLADGAYMNFLDSEEARQNTEKAFGAQKLERLRRIKGQYDPGNLLRFGYDIPPQN